MWSSWLLATSQSNSRYSASKHGFTGVCFQAWLIFIVVGQFQHMLKQAGLTLTSVILSYPVLGLQVWATAQPQTIHFVKEEKNRILESQWMMLSPEYLWKQTLFWLMISPISEVPYVQVQEARWRCDKGGSNMSFSSLLPCQKTWVLLLVEETLAVAYSPILFMMKWSN